jgi:hypothetical protein
MPYEPYNTGWINSIYGSACLFWLLLTNGLLPQFTFMTCYNNIFIPFTKLINQLCEFIGNGIVSVGSGIIVCKSYIFNHIDYIKPIYNCLNYIKCSIASLLPQFKCDIPSYKYAPSNFWRRTTSTGRHLCQYFARKRIIRAQQIISGSNNNNDKSTNDSTHRNSKNACKQNFPSPDPCAHDNYVFYSSDDPSYHDISWYDAISPYWTGGMVWNGAYVLNHQVVSVTTGPIFVSNLLPEHELSATVHTPQVRSGDENVGPRATFALDSGSSIHIFKDAFLLTDIKPDDNQSITVRTTDSKFQISNIGQLCADLNTLPLPSEGYYFYPKGVANILSLAMIAETKRVFMDSAIDNAICIFNEDGSYIRFAKTPNGMYCIDVATDDNKHIVMAHQTVKEESAHFSAIDCRQAAKVRDLQEALACPSDFDLANAIEHNIIGNNPFTKRDVRIAKKIFGPDVPAMKGKTVNSFHVIRI